MTIFLFCRGCFRYCDISVPENMNEIEFLQNKIQPDDACNVQFTSVSIIISTD